MPWHREQGLVDPSLAKSLFEALPHLPPAHIILGDHHEALQWHEASKIGPKELVGVAERPPHSVPICDLRWLGSAGAALVHISIVFARDQLLRCGHPIKKARSASDGKARDQLNALSYI
jgi:hypothetical protein